MKKRLIALLIVVAMMFTSMSVFATEGATLPDDGETTEESNTQQTIEVDLSELDDDENLPPDESDEGNQEAPNIDAEEPEEAEDGKPENQGDEIDSEETDEEQTDENTDEIGEEETEDEIVAETADIDEIINNYASYSELDANEKATFCAAYFVSDADMQAAEAAGLFLLESVQIVSFASKYQTTITQAQALISVLGGYRKANEQLDNLVKYQEDFSLSDNTIAEFRALMLDGYALDDVVYAYVVACAIGASTSDIITYDEEEELSADEDTLQLLLYIKGIYKVSMIELYDYMTEEAISAEDLFNLIVEFQYSEGIYLESKMGSIQTMAAGGGQQTNTPEAPSTYTYQQYASENIDLQNGTLTYTDQMFTLPGKNSLDVSLRLDYRSANAAIETDTSGDEHPVQNDVFGTGWSLALPYMIGGTIFFPDGRTFSAKTPYSTTYGYTLESTNAINVRLYPDDIFYNGDIYSEWRAVDNSGTSDFFKNGRLIGTRDRHGNTIKYRYSTYDGKTVLSQIIDTAGRTIDFTYTTVSSSSRKVTVTLPDGNTVVYTLALTNGYSNTYDLHSRKNPRGMTATYEYAKMSTYYNENPGNPSSVGETTFNSVLSGVQVGTGERIAYYYGKGGECGKGLPYRERILYTKREDVVYNGWSYRIREYDYDYMPNLSLPLDYTDFSDGGIYYVGSYLTEYPKNTETTIYENTTFSVTTLNDAGLPTIVKTYKNSDSQNPVEIRTVEYVPDKSLVAKTTIETYSNGETITQIIRATYDAKGNKLHEYDTQSEGQQTAEHRRTYTYYPDRTYSFYGKAVYYPIINKITYKQDANTTIIDVYDYNNSWNLASAKKYRSTETSANLAARTDYYYDSAGNVSEKRDYKTSSTYITTQFSYNEENPSTRPSNSGFTGLYLTQKKVTNILNADNTSAHSGFAAENYRYDIMGNLVESYDAKGNLTKMTYDGLGYITSKINADQSQEQWAYYGPDVKHISVTGVETYYDFGINGDLLTVKRDDELISAYCYNVERQLTDEWNFIDDEGKATHIQYGYDYLGRATSKSVEGGNYYKATYKSLDYDCYAADNAVLISSENTAYSIQDGLMRIKKSLLTETGEIVGYEYMDKHGRLVKRSVVKNNVEFFDTFEYDYMGNKTQEKTAIAYDEYPNIPFTAKYEYNILGKVTKQTNAVGDYVESEYDMLGRLVAVSDYKANTLSTPHKTTYVYDNLSRTVLVNKPVANIANTMYYNIVKMYYDAAGNVVQTKETSNEPTKTQMWDTVSKSYNNRNLVETVTVNNIVTRYEYNALGKNTKLITGNGKSENTYVYDEYGRLKQSVDALDLVEEYTYDLVGNMLTKTDRNGDITIYIYDAAGRKVSMNSKGTSAQTVYGLSGQVLSVQNNNLTVSYEYDDLGRVFKEIEPGGIVKEYGYNIANLRTSYKLSVNNVIQVNTTYTYDHLNRLKTVSEAGVLQATYNYDENGNRKSLVNANGTSAVYEYDLANQVIDLKNKKSSNIISSYAYAYYLNGNQLSKTDNNGKKTTYVYDTSGRLKSETETGGTENSTYTYVYDVNSNRTKMTVTGHGAKVVDYTYDIKNQLITEKEGNWTTCYSYDKNGNQIFKTKESSVARREGGFGDTTGTILAANYSVTLDKDLIEQYEYNGINQLVSVTKDGAKTGYTYKVNGLRHTKSSQGNVIKHIWDGQNISAELKNGIIDAKYIRGVNLLASISNAGTRKTYLYNAHGDVVQLTNTSGNVLWRYEYDAFGVEKEITGQDTETDINPFRYCGEYFDKETGSIYLRARYYNPRIGRFITQDPIKAGLNWYTYTGNNPVRFADPLGLVSGVIFGPNEGADWLRTGSGKTFEEFWGCGPYGAPLSGTTGGDNVQKDEVQMSKITTTDAITVVETDAGITLYAYVKISGAAADMIVPGDLGDGQTTYRQAAIDGIIQGWSGMYKGKPVKVVIVDLYDGADHVVKSGQQSIWIEIKNEKGVSNMSTNGMNWSKTNPGTITLYLGHFGGSSNYSKEYFGYIAAHEFGHVLGIADLYNDTIFDIKPDSIMNDHGLVGGQAQDVDFAMMLRAQATGVWQPWQSNKDLLDELGVIYG